MGRTSEPSPAPHVPNSPPFLAGSLVLPCREIRIDGARHAQVSRLHIRRRYRFTRASPSRSHSAEIGMDSRRPFAVACWMLRERPLIDVPREMPRLIRAYNSATGVANTTSSGYHETITQASIRAARDFLDRNPSRPLVVTCNALLTSSLGRPDWLLVYWTRQASRTIVDTSRTIDVGYEDLRAEEPMYRGTLPR